MVFFSKMRRSGSVNGNPYPSQPGVIYPTPHPSRHPSLHQQHSQRLDYAKQAPPQVSWESIPRSTVRPPSSEVSLPEEYTNVNIDTSRYPNQRSAHLLGPRHGLRMPGLHRRKTDPTDSYQDVNHYARANEIHSHVAPMLAVGSVTIVWDVRESPAHMRQARNARPATDITAPATSTQARHVSLISHEFPWTIDIQKKDSRPLAVLDIIEALYEALGRELRRSEWALAVDGQRYAMQKANKHRRQSDMAKRFRRVDWLGSRTIFRGLERDDNLARKRLMPGERPQGETWVVRFGSQR